MKVLKILKNIPNIKSYFKLWKSSEYFKNWKLHEGKDLYFSFEFVDKPKMSKEINELDMKKAFQEHDIPVKLIKSNKDLFSHFINHNFKKSLFSSSFSSNLKVADILPTHKKEYKSDVENYWPISILPMLSMIYKKCICDEMCKYFD